MHVFSDMLKVAAKWGGVRQGEALCSRATGIRIRGNIFVAAGSL